MEDRIVLDLKEMLSQTQRYVNELERENDELERKHDSLRTKIAELEAENGRLRELLGKLWEYLDENIPIWPFTGNELMSQVKQALSQTGDKGKEGGAGGE